MSCQTDISFIRLWDKCGLVALVEFPKVFVCRLGLTDAIENVEERSVLLPIYLFQLYRDVVYLCQSFGSEEIGSVVIRCQQALVFWGHHWSQLLKVSNHQ